MGQTLTHGIYLPDEGERNCYAGLAGNWQLLDGSVGTIAEHTSALAGKAPLVHTHGNITNDGKVGTAANKPLITGTDGVVQAGSFGNAANTFCEGNDSRLSDARTPVAHTHTKSDVTDLLNSNFIPSANNSYDLGSSSYQWNNLYAKRVNTQSVNGINPGALSLPDSSKSVTVDTTNYTWTGPDNTYVALADGWLSLKTTTGLSGRLEGTTTGIGSIVERSPGGRLVLLHIPVLKNESVTVSGVGSDFILKFYPCLGNV